MIQSSGIKTSSRTKFFDKKQLATLVNMESPEAVHKEVSHILSQIGPSIDQQTLNRAFKFTVDLYEGQLEGYRACNTDYHNLRHITDTYLAMARLLHGARLGPEEVRDREIVLGLIGALMHDSGMIQEECDTEGTGAKYTREHVKLSIDFVAKHAAALGITEREVPDLRDMILCTDLMVDIRTINFSTPRIAFLGKLLGTADLIAQMADRTYLEKLLFLYHEFREAGIGHYENELDFLHQTLNFFKMSACRFRETLDNTSRFMVPHFKVRWGIDENLYILSLENQHTFLKKILTNKDISIYQALKRDNLMEKLRRRFGYHMKESLFHPNILPYQESRP